jgi:hypothetical protein
MSTIRCIYDKAPNFPATDQHPDAVRYQVGSKWVDAIGGQPTQAEIDAVLNPVPVPDNGAALEQSRVDTLRKEIDDQIGSLSGDQQAVLRNMLKLIDKEI